MPSRRRFLAAAAGVGLATPLSGCLVHRARAETGYLQVKAVSVSWRHDGRRWEDEVLLATTDGESELQCRVAREYAAMVDDPAEIRVTGEMERRLERDFLDVAYVTGFCWSDAGTHTCRNPQASRATFNGVQFGDRADVVFRSPGVELLGVYEGAQGDPGEWETEVRTFDFAALHEDDGVPIDGRRGIR